MKKNTLKAFTLVEMLIVIVIIGILIAALLPRMSAAQGRARDVSRKTALSQIQSAIVSYQGDKGDWPMLNSGAKDGMGISKDTNSDIAKALLNAGMSGIPSDPLQTQEFEGLGTTNTITGGMFGYLVLKRNGAENAGFVLMARSEMEGGSNWVVCSGAATLDQGKISNADDLKNISLCPSVSKGDTCNGGTGCTYANDSELRYIAIY